MPPAAVPGASGRRDRARRRTQERRCAYCAPATGAIGAGFWHAKLRGGEGSPSRARALPERTKSRRPTAAGEPRRAAAADAPAILGERARARCARRGGRAVVVVVVDLEDSAALVEDEVVVPRRRGAAGVALRTLAFSALYSSSSSSFCSNAVRRRCSAASCYGARRDRRLRCGLMGPRRCAARLAFCGGSAEPQWCLRCVFC